MSFGSIFQNVISNQPGRSVFDLSYSKLLTCDMGQLIPVMVDEVVPGDKFDISTEMVLRMNPLVSPVMHEIYAHVHYFFVPNRLVWEDWEDFITQGVEGPQVPEVGPVMPVFDPVDDGVGSLWDYFGMPVDVTPDANHLPTALPFRAYNLIWNEYYRDQNVMAEIDITTSQDVLMRCWAKDYFASALPWQQRGDAPALPLSGTTNAEWTSASFVNGSGGTPLAALSTPDTPLRINGAVEAANVLKVFNNNIVEFSDAGTFTVSDLRLAFQIQRWMELNARAGARYTEQLKAHFGVSNGDARLQRPEYIGGVKYPVIVSEVLQTSATAVGSPQGNLAGHGITAGRNFAGKYFATEHGWIIGLFSIMPVPMYMQGIDRQFLRKGWADYYTPEFANLSEQMIERCEIFASAVEAENQTEFGYQGRYDEMRVKRNQVCGLMRTDFDHWHLARDFAAAPELNEDFLLMDSVTGGALNPFKRIFAVPSEPGFVVTVGNLIKAVRPMPIQSNPGLIDHI